MPEPKIGRSSIYSTGRTIRDRAGQAGRGNRDPRFPRPALKNPLLGDCARSWTHGLKSRKQTPSIWLRDRVLAFPPQRGPLAEITTGIGFLTPPRPMTGI